MKVRTRTYIMRMCIPKSRALINGRGQIFIDSQPPLLLIPGYGPASPSFPSLTILLTVLFFMGSFLQPSSNLEKEDTSQWSINYFRSR